MTLVYHDNEIIRCSKVYFFIILYLLYHNLYIIKYITRSFGDRFWSVFALPKEQNFFWQTLSKMQPTDAYVLNMALAEG